MKVVGDQGVNSNTEVIVHEHSRGRQTDTKMSPGNNPNFPSVHFDKGRLEPDFLQKLIDVGAGVAAGSVSQGPGEIIAGAEGEDGDSRGSGQSHLVYCIQEPAKQKDIRYQDEIFLSLALHKCS